MGNVMLNVPWGDVFSLGLFSQEFDMSVASHSFTVDEMPKWSGYGGRDILDGYWDRALEYLYVFGQEQNITEVTHIFTESEMPRWRGYTGVGLPEGCWNRENRTLCI